MTWAAAMMTRVTAPGREIRDRCPESTSVMWALARLDMNSCSAGGITRSAVPRNQQDRVARPGGTPGGPKPEVEHNGRLDAGAIESPEARAPLPQARESREA